MKRTLTPEQCKRLLTVVSMRASKKSIDQALITSLLLSGSQARTWTWESALSHFLDLPISVYEALRDLAKAKQLTIFPFNHVGFTAAHWIGGNRYQHSIFAANDRKTALTTQEVTRRMKRYAKLAGLNANEMSLRTLVNTHHALMTQYGNADRAAEEIGISVSAIAKPFKSTKSTSRPDARLHGIGRRSLSMKTA